MKKLILLFSLALVSCETTVPQTSLKNQKIEDVSIKIYEIDGCEYIVRENGNATWGSHKGNCKQCVKNHYYK